MKRRYLRFNNTCTRQWFGEESVKKVTDAQTLIQLSRRLPVHGALSLASDRGNAASLSPAEATEVHSVPKDT